MRFLFIVFLALGTAFPALAQRADSPCAYDACALRYEPSFFGTRLVRGVEGTPAGSSLSVAVAASPRALDYARLYERTRTPALLATLSSAVLVAIAATPAEDGLLRLGDGTRLALMAGGIGVGIVGIRLNLQTHRARSRAVWWYNQGLGR